MNKKSQTVFRILVVLALFLLALRDSQYTKDARTFNLELREQVQTEVHVMTWNQFYDIKERLKLLEEAMWLEGYEHTELESMPHMNNRLLQEQFRDILMNTVAIHDLEKLVGFPYINQYAPDSPYLQDCGSASLLMAVRHYGFGMDDSVKTTHKAMMDGDYPADFYNIVRYIEEEFGDDETSHYLTTKVVTTSQPILNHLERNDYDVSEIEIVEPEDIPWDKPVIWIYAATPHWVVRYAGWNFDASIGVYRFEETKNIYRPELGLGIIVEEVWQ